MFNVKIFLNFDTGVYKNIFWFYLILHKAFRNNCGSIFVSLKVLIK